MTAFVGIVNLIWFVASIGIAVLHDDWLKNMYSDDSVESYIDRAILAMVSLPFFVGCTIAYWLHWDGWTKEEIKKGCEQVMGLFNSLKEMAVRK